MKPIVHDMAIRGVTLLVSYTIEGQDLSETNTDPAESQEVVLGEIKVFDSDEPINDLLAETVIEDIQEQLQRLWSNR